MSVSKDLVDIIKGSDDKGTKAYDTSATVTRVDGTTVWVHIPGGVDETPVKRTINAKEGDVVQVHVSGGSAWLNGNTSAPPTDDTQANLAVEYALVAGNAADSAVKSAKDASEAAADAKATADSVHGIATQALADATTAKDAADNASEYAARALGNLSTVQSITETLNWITAHGTMALTTDVALDPTHVYFVVDAGGDYVVGGVTYAIVTEPDVDDIGTYYELTIDESLNNYVGTHLALTSEGLWLLPASSGTNKVLIAVGGVGHTYPDAGTYIIDSSNNVLAKFLATATQIGSDSDNNVLIDSNSVDLRDSATVLATFSASGAVVGISDGTQSFLLLDYHSMQMIDRDGNVYFYVSDLRDSSGNVTATHTGDGVTTLFEPLSGTLISTVTEVTINGVSTTQYTYTAGIVSFTTAPSNGSTIVIKYIPDNASFVKAFTAGLRWTGHGDVGPMSFVENTQNVASGFSSHAEGQYTQSTGTASHSEGSYTYATRAYAHAEGLYSHADGYCSHAQNYSTKAESAYQTVIGQNNVADSADAYAFIIGNGTSANARSNALTVDWSGRIQCGNYSGTLTSIFDLFYPVGSYYETSDTSFDPNVTWGGTWTLETEGLVHIGAGTNYTVGATGGAKEVTLDVTQIPSHTHVVNYVNYNRGSGSNATMGYLSSSAQTNHANTENTGGGQPHENMPPYIVVNRWHRTA